MSDGENAGLWRPFAEEGACERLTRPTGETLLRRIPLTEAETEEKLREASKLFSLFSLS
jgi:hypothetical protein